MKSLVELVFQLSLVTEYESEGSHYLSSLKKNLRKVKGKSGKAIF
jgi:hypothetical protein